MSTDGAAFCKAKAATAFLSLGQDGEWEMGPGGLGDPSDVGFEHLPPCRVRSLDFGGIGRSSVCKAIVFQRRLILFSSESE